MKIRWFLATLLSVLVVAPMGLAQDAAKPLPAIRPPAVPLITHDPYFSVWSMHDRLHGDWPKHWTGAVNAMCGMVRVDGKAYRIMGMAPQDAPVLEQKGVQVLPTRTIYDFEGAGVAVTLTFMTPAFPHDLELMSRPISYVTWKVRATDGKAHEVAVYLDVTGEWVVDKANQEVVWSRPKEAAWDGLTVMRMGSKDQKVLGRTGDNLRIEWGHVYLAVPNNGSVKTAIASDREARGAFAKDATLPANDDERMPRAASDNWPVLTAAIDFGRVTDAAQERHVLIGYDDQYSIQYFNKNLMGYWTKFDDKLPLGKAERQYAEIKEKCRKYDEELIAELRAAGGDAFATLGAMSFRQCIAAHKLVADEKGRPLYFSKENFSNGCIATVDVTYPSSPFFLLFNPELLAAQVVPILEYASMTDRWKFPFAPHDLGQYPKANGQVYGGGEKSEKDQMPVEECGNMLIMMTALAHTGRLEEVKQYWPLMTKWAEYLKEKGLDPENQLCTDDFAGHLAHNTNLSVKAIVALGGYAKLCERVGKDEEGAAYLKLAKEMAQQWMKMADDGDHYRLTFDKAGTWSQKYNLVWDELLGLGLFPKEVARKEIAYYLKMQNAYGLPLDNRKAYTKLDWILWTATMTENRADFDALVSPLYAWMNATPARVPMTDWYDTVNGRQQGFQARSVVGGVFIPLLKSEGTWKKWAERAKPSKS